MVGFERVSDRIELVSIPSCKVGALGEVLPQQPVCFHVRGPLLGTVGVVGVARNAGSLFRFHILGQLSDPVPGQRFANLSTQLTILAAITFLLASALPLPQASFFLLAVAHHGHRVGARRG